MHKLIASLALLLTTLVALPASACTDPRPSGSAGSAAVPMATYVVGMVAAGSQIRVYFHYAGVATPSQQLISMGPDTGITFSGGYLGSGYANRIVSITPQNGFSGPGGAWRTSLRINGTHDLVFNGSDGLIGSGGVFRGASGGLTRVSGTTRPSYIHPGEVDGILMFDGTDNGAALQRTMTVVGAEEPGTPCTEPEAARVVPRSGALAFFPELAAVTRQWWES